MENEKDHLGKLEELLKDYWRQSGHASVIAAKHTEFVVEPRVFIGNKLNPEILKLLVLNYLVQTSKQDSGIGNIEATPDKLVIKSPKGRPMVVVRDPKIIQQYLSAQA